MLVVGLTKIYSAKLGHKAALGAGAIVKDIICGRDGLDPEDKVKKMINISPDMVLLTGGVNNEFIANVSRYAELIKKAKVNNKYKNNRVPIVYSGNKYAVEVVKQILKDYPLFITNNICKRLKLSNSKQLQKKVTEIFFQHVMEDAPGYNKLKKIVTEKILPTPIAVLKTMKLFSNFNKDKNILMFDIGGATTDIFTLYYGKFLRSVSANIGMSYSIANVLKKVGLEKIKKYLNINISDKEILNYIGNKNIAPTSLPQNTKEEAIEEAVAINAIKLAVNNHLELYRNEFEALNEMYEKGGIKNLFFKKKSSINFEIIIGSGGIISNNKDAQSRTRIMTRAFEKYQIDNFYFDNSFMFPHIGAFSQSENRLAQKILFEISLSKLNNEVKIKSQARDRIKKYNKELKVKKKPIIKLNNVSKLKIDKMIGDKVSKKEVLALIKEKVYRKYYIPITINKTVKVIYKSGKKLLKKNDLIIKLKLSKYTYEEIRAPFNCKLIEIKNYVVIVQERTNIDKIKVKLLRPDIKRKQTERELNQLYNNKLIDRKFKMQEVILHYTLSHSYILSPISGKVVEHDKTKQEIILNRIVKTDKVVSYASGIIQGINDTYIKIQSYGYKLTGKIGNGCITEGRIYKSISLITNKVEFEHFLKSRIKAGLVYSIPYADYKKINRQDRKKSLIVFNNFSDYEENENFKLIIKKIGNNLIYFSPKTRIRAGVERPFIYWETDKQD